MQALYTAMIRSTYCQNRPHNIITSAGNRSIPGNAAMSTLNPLKGTGSIRMQTWHNMDMTDWYLWALAGKYKNIISQKIIWTFN